VIGRMRAATRVSNRAHLSSLLVTMCRRLIVRREQVWRSDLLINRSSEMTTSDGF